MTWTGECANGAIVGRGSLTIVFLNGGQEKFDGATFKGTFLNGAFVRTTGVSYIGQFTQGSGLFERGRRLDKDGKVTHEGTFVGFDKLSYGTAFLENGEKFEGEMSHNIDEIDYISGRGIAEGKSSLNDQAVRWYVSGMVYRTEAEFNGAANVRERIRQEQSQQIIAKSRSVIEETTAAMAKRAEITEKYFAEQAVKDKEKNEKDRKETFQVLGQIGEIVIKNQRDKVDQQQNDARIAAQRAAMLASQQQEIAMQNQRSVNAQIPIKESYSSPAETTKANPAVSAQQSNLDRSLADKRMSDEVERKNKEYEKQRLIELNKKKLSESLALQKARELELAARVNEQQIKKQREEQEQKEAALERHRREVAFERATSASISAELNQPNAVTVTVMNHRCPVLSIRNNMRRASAIVTIDANINGVRQGGYPHNVTNSMTFLILAGSKQERSTGGGLDCDQPWSVTPNATWIEGKQN